MGLDSKIICHIFQNVIENMFSTLIWITVAHSKVGEARKGLTASTVWRHSKKIVTYEPGSWLSPDRELAKVYKGFEINARGSLDEVNGPLR